MNDIEADTGVLGELLNGQVLFFFLFIIVLDFFVQCQGVPVRLACEQLYVIWVNDDPVQSKFVFSFGFSSFQFFICHHIAFKNHLDGCSRKHFNRGNWLYIYFNPLYFFAYSMECFICAFNCYSKFVFRHEPDLTMGFAWAFYSMIVGFEWH